MLHLVSNERTDASIHDALQGRFVLIVEIIS